ncbi:MAG: hypothetical protein CVU84_05955 [Firmicutes bacterium HGW-Firmicutes-1]|jgi:DNA mismatch repair ATPase MutS|nr:MAG: hypothetical protein CVU84_05955 [Firmicutes bacterium HGW-Firmicutes-1]
MVFNSLIWLEDSMKQKIDARVIIDLGLNTIYRSLMSIIGSNDLIINELCLDQKTIYYRQEVLKDFMNSPELLSNLMEGLSGIIQLKGHLNQGKEETNLFCLVNLVIIVEAIILSLEALHKTLLHYEIKSEGLSELKEAVITKTSMNSFKDMKRDLNEVRYILSKIKSVEVSINMSVDMRPEEVRVTEINDNSYRFPLAFRMISESVGVSEKFLGLDMNSYVPLFNLENVDWDILDELANAFKSHKDVFNQFVKRYQKVDIKPFITLLEELTFYQASYEMSNQLKRLGLPQCVPKLLNANERAMYLNNFYNVNTAFEKMNTMESLPNKSIILNDITMNNEARIFILTGPNMGGKTTITQAIGQIQIFAQLGLLVPAEQASISLADNIFTHFSVEEKETVDLGRLGKECEMFSTIFHQSSDKSLLLLNESFSGTSHLESLKIAEEAVMAAKYKRLRMVYNTHLHELAATACNYNDIFNNDTHIISILIGDKRDILSYKIKIGEPLGMSYARDEAYKYGITYEQLTGKEEVNTYGKSNLQFVVVK